MSDLSKLPLHIEQVLFQLLRLDLDPAGLRAEVPVSVEGSVKFEFRGMIGIAGTACHDGGVGGRAKGAAIDELAPYVRKRVGDHST